MAKPIRPAQFITREIALFVLVMTLATVLTIWGTFYVLETFVLGNHNDPLTKAGGPSPLQEQGVRKGKMRIALASSDVLGFNARDGFELGLHQRNHLGASVVVPVRRS